MISTWMRLLTKDSLYGLAPHLDLKISIFTAHDDITGFNSTPFDIINFDIYFATNQQKSENSITFDFIEGSNDYVINYKTTLGYVFSKCSVQTKFHFLVDIFHNLRVQNVFKCKKPFVCMHIFPLINTIYKM